MCVFILPPFPLDTLLRWCERTQAVYLRTQRWRRVGLPFIKGTGRCRTREPCSQQLQGVSPQPSAHPIPALYWAFTPKASALSPEVFWLGEAGGSMPRIPPAEPCRAYRLPVFLTYTQYKHLLQFGIVQTNLSFLPPIVYYLARFILKTESL